MLEHIDYLYTIYYPYVKSLGPTCSAESASTLQGLLVESRTHVKNFLTNATNIINNNNSKININSIPG